VLENPAIVNRVMTTWCKLATLAAVVVIVIGANALAIEVNTNSSVRYQTIEGWGTSGVPPSGGNTTAWLTAYRNLGLNILRMKMDQYVLVHPSGDQRIRIPLSNDLQANIDLFDFRATSTLVKQGETARWLSENALEPERARVVGSFWTPPHWMKGPTGRTQNFVGITQNYPTPFTAGEAAEVTWLPDGHGDSIGGRLRTEDPVNLAEYGQYAAAWVKGFEQQWGVDFYALSLQNESTFENPFDSMVLNIDQNGDTDFGQYALALDAVRAAWQQHGIDTKIKGPHVAQVGPTPQNPWSLLAQNNYIEAVKDAGDPTLIDFLDFYNSNYYMPFDESGVQATAGYYRGKDAVDAPWVFWAFAPGVAQDNKPIWYSETGGATSAWINGAGGTVGNGAITVALKMFNALVHSDASAYIYWQFTDGNNSNSTSHSLIGASDLADPDESEKYAAFKHFSRYVRPGAARIESTFTGGHASVGGASQYDTLHSVNVSAFLHEEDQTLTYVLLNMTDSPESVTINLPNEFTFEAFDHFRSSEVERFEKLATLHVQNDLLSLSLPRFSLVTLVGSFLVAPELHGDYNDDGKVDAADYVVWRKNDGTQSDYDMWRANFGRNDDNNSGAGTYAAVPEPTILIMFVGAIIVLSIANARQCHQLVHREENRCKCASNCPQDAAP
jgi:O-glycosyl hydrolase